MRSMLGIGIAFEWYEIIYSTNMYTQGQWIMYPYDFFQSRVRSTNLPKYFSREICYEENKIVSISTILMFLQKITAGVSLYM